MGVRAVVNEGIVRACAATNEGATGACDAARLGGAGALAAAEAGMLGARKLRQKADEFLLGAHTKCAIAISCSPCNANR